MRQLVRLSLFLVLLGVAWGCSRENTATTASADTDQEVPLTPPQAKPEAVPSPLPAPAPAQIDAARPAVRPAPKPAPPAPAPASEPVPAAKPAAAAPAPPVESARLDPDPPAPAPRVAPPAPPAVEMQTVPAGTPITVVMAGEVSSEMSKNGDTFEATLAEPWIVDGNAVANRGDTVIGRVQDVMRPGKVKGKAQLTLTLTEIFPGSRGYKITTEPFVAIAVDNKERDAAIIAGGAGIGAAIGAITGGKKGAAIGAIIGGGGGTATVLATPGQDMKIEPETKVNFILDDAVRLPVIRNRPR